MVLGLTAIVGLVLMLSGGDLRREWRFRRHERSIRRERSAMRAAGRARRLRLGNDNRKGPR